MAVLPAPPLLPLGSVASDAAPHQQKQRRRNPSHQQQQEQERQDPFVSSLSHLWDHLRINQRSPIHTEKASKDVFLMANRPKPHQVNSRPSVLHDDDDNDDEDDDGGDCDDDDASPRPQQCEEVGGKSSSAYSSNGRRLQTLCKEGQLDRALDVLSHMHTALPSSIYMTLLKACIRRKALAQAKQVHVHLAQFSPNLTSLLGGYLVVTLAKCGAIEDACLASSRLPHRSVFSWTAIISAYAECGNARKALEMYQFMQDDGVEPNEHTFSTLFKACGSIPDLEQGRKLHAKANGKGFASDIFVGSTLVSMYSKCGTILEAENVFTMMSQRDAVAWNAMLLAYVEHGQEDKAIQLYRQMQEEQVTADNYTLMSVIQACGNLVEKEAALVSGVSATMVSQEIGRALLADARMKDFASDAFVSTALLSMFGKCGAIVEAEKVFLAMSPRSIVSWTAMLSAYTEQGQAENALQVYKQLQEEGLSPDQGTFVVALKACAILAEKVETKGQPIKVMPLEIGQALHADACKKGFVSDVLVGTALVTMYGKCGAIEAAENTFGALSAHDNVSWTAMLSVYVEHGQGRRALHFYKQMKKNCSTPDYVTLVCILQACTERGSLEICRQLHFDIVSLGYDHIGFMAATLIHTYASCASIVDAQEVFDRLSDPDVVSWNACIAGHTGEGSVYMYEKMKMEGIEPNQSTFTSVLSACSHAGLVVRGVECFKYMSDYNVNPNIMHYGIMVGLVGRAGDFQMVADMLKRIPMLSDMSVWLSLLSACHTHGNLELAKQAFDYAVNLQPNEGTTYVLMSNIYADAGLEENAAKVEEFRKKRVQEDALQELE